jgi:hypothetical protein
MFAFDIDLLNSDLIQGRVRLVESKDIVIGIQDTGAKAAIAAPKEDGYRKLPNDSSGRQVRKIKGRDPEYTIAEQLLDLEDWGLFSDALSDPANQDLIGIFDRLEEIFTSGEYGDDAQNLVTNFARALIRNRIIDGRLGSNSQETAEEKGFNMPLMDTGTLFTAIRAWLEDN